MTEKENKWIDPKEKPGHQMWLDPEWEAESEYKKRHEIGKKIFEGDVCKVPGITVDSDVRDLVANWPIEISASRIRVLRPYGLYNVFPPKDVVDFTQTENFTDVVIKKVDDFNISVEFKIDGKQKKITLTYFPEQNQIQVSIGNKNRDSFW